MNLTNRQLDGVVGAACLLALFGASCGGGNGGDAAPTALSTMIVVSTATATEQSTPTQTPVPSVARTATPGATRTATRDPTATISATATISPSPTATEDVSAEPAYQGPGPYVVGVRTLRLGDRDVEVWYPAVAGSEEGLPKATYDTLEQLPQAIIDLVRATIPGLSSTIEMEAFRDLPVSGDGPFPIILFSHAFGGFRQANSNFTAGAASWGFVVASADHLERGILNIAGLPAPDPPRLDFEVLTSTTALLEELNGAAGGPFEGRIDASRIAVTGHSAGGAAALALPDLPGVRAVVAFAAPAFLPPKAVSSSTLSPGIARSTMLIAADSDIAIPVDFSRRLFDRFVRTPKRLVIIGGTGHDTFTDLCPAIRALGGLTGLPLPFPPSFVELADDGCIDEDFPAEQAWPIIQHFAVAHIRDAFGIDDEPVGLGPGIAGAFSTNVQYTDEP